MPLRRRDAKSDTGVVFERFTDRARRVVVLAQEEARLLNHNYIGTEHILLGLIPEGRRHRRQGARVARHLPRGRAQPGRGDHRSGWVDAVGAHPVHAPGQEGARAVAPRGARSSATTTSAPSTSCSGSSAKARASPRRCYVKLGADLSRVRQQVIQLLLGLRTGQQRRSSPWSQASIPGDVDSGPVRARIGPARPAAPGHADDHARGAAGVLERRRRSACSRCCASSSSRPPRPTIRCSWRR